MVDAFIFHFATVGRTAVFFPHIGMLMYCHCGPLNMMHSPPVKGWRLCHVLGSGLPSMWEVGYPSKPLFIHLSSADATWGKRYPPHLPSTTQHSAASATLYYLTALFTHPTFSTRGRLTPSFSVEPFLSFPPPTPNFTTLGSSSATGSFRPSQQSGVSVSVSLQKQRIKYNPRLRCSRDIEGSVRAY